MGMFEISQISNMKGVKCVHINARSLFNKLADISNNFFFCDVIIITETWLTNMIPTSAININGFTVTRQDRSVNIDKRGGGICVYIKNGYTFDKIDDLCLVTVDYEMVTIKVKIKNIKPYYIIGVYRPPSGSLSKFMEGMRNGLDSLDLTRTELVMVGDMNIDYNSIYKSFEEIENKKI